MPASGGGNRSGPTSLESALEQSSARLESLVATEETSPSEAMVRAERLVELAMALSGLPEDQRTAVELRYLQGLSVLAVAEQMGRSTVSVTGCYTGEPGRCGNGWANPNEARPS